MSTFYDALETRSTAEREGALMAALAAADRPCPEGIARVRQHSGGGGCWCGHQPRGIGQVPVTRKYELLERQQPGRATNVFGGFSALNFGPGMTRVCQPRHHLRTRGHAA